MKPIAIFYHCLFSMDGDIMPAAYSVVRQQMDQLVHSGLLYATTEFHAGVNGGKTSHDIAVTTLPCAPTFHGDQCRNECRTIQMIEDWLPGHEDWYVLYFHAKGCTHPPADPLRGNWRECMMKHLVTDWRKCVSDLDRGYEAVGCHWMEPPRTPDTQYIFAGNFWWAKASFLVTLPRIAERARIKDSGIDALESRYESEVWLGNGPRRPKVKDYHAGWNISPDPHP